MKFYYLVAALLLQVSIVNAQQTFFNLEAGLNSSKFVYGPKTITNSSSLYRYYLGGTLDVQIKSFAIQPGIIFSTNGGNNISYVDADGQKGTVTNRMTLRYLLFPLNVTRRFAVGNNYFSVGGGAYFGYGLEGKNFGDTKLENNNPSHHDYDIYFGYLTENIRNHDFGFDFLLGYELNRIGIKAAYTFGLRNLSNSNEPPYSKNRILSLGLTYKLAEIKFL